MKKITFVMRIERVCEACGGRGYPPHDGKATCPDCTGKGVTVEERDVTKEVNGAMELANAYIVTICGVLRAQFDVLTETIMDALGRNEVK